MEIKSGQTIDIYTQENEHLSVTWTETTGFIVDSETSAVTDAKPPKQSVTPTYATPHAKLARKDYFTNLTNQQQIDLASLALNVVVATGSHDTVKDALDYLIDSIVELTN